MDVKTYAEELVNLDPGDYCFLLSGDFDDAIDAYTPTLQRLAAQAKQETLAEAAPKPINTAPVDKYIVVGAWSDIYKAWMIIADAKRFEDGEWEGLERICAADQLTHWWEIPAPPKGGA